MLQTNFQLCRSDLHVDHYAQGFWLFTGLKKSFLSKVKGMNDRGIRRTFPLCAQIFEFLVQTPIFTKIVRAIYM